MSNTASTGGRFSATAIVTTSFGAVATSLTIAAAAYNLGKSAGTDFAQAQCATASAADKAELSRTSASLSIALERIKTVEQYNSDWRKSYEASQQMVANQATQIASLETGVKRSDVCEFFKAQVRDLQYRLDNWRLSDQDRAQITASKDAVIARMDGCMKGQ